MTKFRKIIFYSMIPVTLILIAEGLLYYSFSGLTVPAVILCTLDNAVKAFLGRPTISPYYAFRDISENYTRLEKIFVYLYGMVLIFAPILMTSAVIAGFQAYLLDFWYSVKPSRKKKLVVIGDGASADNIARRYAGQYQVIYMMPEGTGDQARVALLKSGVNAYSVDYNNIEKFLDEIKTDTVSAVVLDFKDWFGSCKVTTDVINYLFKNTKGEKKKLHIINGPKLYRDIFDSIYGGLLKKYGKPADVLAVSFDNVNEYNARKFFQDPGFTKQPENRHHMVVLGLGSYGRTVLVYLVSYMMTNGIWGNIEVFDQNLSQNMNDLFYSPEIVEYEDMLRIAPKAENASLSVSIETGPGPITVNYYETKIGSLDYTRYMETITKRGRVTEWFFCIDDVALNFECYRMMLSENRGSTDVRVYFRASSDLRESMQAIELNTGIYRQLIDGVLDIDL